jgi:hypothetical protein
MYICKMRIALSFWMASLEKFGASCGVPNVEEAAKQMIASPEYNDYRRYVRILGDCWHESYFRPAEPAEG